MSFPTRRSADTFAPVSERGSHRLDVYLDELGELQDVRLDGESLWPIWFKVEWKGNGQLSAKIAGQRLSTREGDEIRFLVGAELGARSAADGA
jgi:hypothetical protein